MRRGALAGATAGVVVSLALSPASAFPPDVPDERPTLVAGALAAAHRIDGVLDEPEWASAPASTDLRDGGAPAGRAARTAATVVRVLGGPKALVFGIRCEDPEPSGIVTFTKERDGDFEAEDHVVVVLDPFQDGRSGYVFAVNPGGARFDALVQPGGEAVDPNWDGEWEAGTRRDGRAGPPRSGFRSQTLSFPRGPAANGA